MIAYCIILGAFFSLIGYFAFQIRPVKTYSTFAKLFANSENHISENHISAYSVFAIESGKSIRFIVMSPSRLNAMHKAKLVCPSADSITIE
jgi:hypothetical protein